MVPTPATPSDRSAVVLATVLAAVAVAFLPTLWFGFVRWDDPMHVFENPLVLRPGSVPWIEHLTTPGLGYPTPVAVLSYRAEAAIFGLQRPGAFHATNVALHLLACALALRLGRRIGLGLAGAALATLVFGLHPVCAEPVSWISGRKDLLALVLCLGSVSLALPGVDGRGTRTRRAASIALFALALLSKPVSAYAVAMIALLRATLPSDGPRPGARALAVLVAPYLLLVALVAPVAALGQLGIGATPSRAPWVYLRDVWYALGFHLRLVAFAQEPTAKYLPIHPSPFAPAVDLAPLVFVVAILTLLRWLPSERRRPALIGLAWAGASYLPSSNVIPLTRFLADSYLYGSVVGLAWTAGVLFEHWLDRFGDRARLLRVALPIAVALPLSLLTVASSARYHDSVALWSHVYERYPGDHRVCRLLALAWYDVATAREVLVAIDRCMVRFGPEHFEAKRAMALYLLGRLDESERWFSKAADRRRAAALPDDPVIGHYQARIAARRRDARGDRGPHIGEAPPAEARSQPGEP